MEISNLFGLPAHPLLVHVPVVLIPLAALGAIAIAVRPAWRIRFGALVVAIAGVGLLGLQLAMGAGEELEEHVKETEAVERHADLAGITRLSAIVFFVVVTAFVVYDHRRRSLAIRTGPGSPAAVRPSRLLVALAALTVVTSILATGAVVQAGHTGAEAVWERTDQQSGGER